MADAFGNSSYFIINRFKTTRHQDFKAWWFFLSPEQV